MKISVPNKENHYALWNWLAEHPTKGKSNWPGFKTLSNLDAMPEITCFACIEYDHDCDFCPLRKAAACSSGYKPSIAFWQWKNARDKKERTRLALLIRDAWK